MAKQYGKWKILEQLGEGGQAHVYKVKTEGDSALQYALKRLKNPDRIKRFEREIRAGVTLNHKNIVEYVDSDIEHDPAYLVTKYYSNGSLEEWYHDEMSLHTRIKLFLGICEGVLHAHSQEPPIVHRDLKPANIFIDDNGNPRIGDFGLCHLEDGEIVTATDEAVGSRNFMAPELEDGKSNEVGTWCDIYSLGKVLYWLVSGKEVFSREKQNEPRYNLFERMGRERNYKLLHDLMNEMIVHDYNGRIRVDKIIQRLNNMSENINKSYNRIGKGIPQKCIYCGIGEYKLKVHIYPESGMAHDWGKQSPFMLSQTVDRRSVGTARIAVCDYCGNTQYFFIDQIDKSENKDVWGDPRSK